VDDPKRESCQSFVFRSRARLIGATIALQVLVLAAGAIAISVMTRTGVGEHVQEQALSDHERAINSLGAKIAELGEEPLTTSHSDWARVQRLVELEQAPPGATLLILDEAGNVLCHPSLARNPNLRRMNYAEQLVRVMPEGELWQLGNFSPRAIVSTEAEMLSGAASLTVSYDPLRKIKIVITQPQEAIAAASSRMAEGLTVVVGCVTVMVLLTTAAGSFALVRRYDTQISRANIRLEREVQERTQSGLAIRNGLIFGLAKLADYRDTDTGRHLERISRYCEILAQHLQKTFTEITPDWIELLKLASSMHDIGKVGIPDSVLLKPGGLTDSERSLMQRHTLIGSDTLLAIRKRVGNDELLNMGIQVALEHHERFDGFGYPYGLAGEEIALPARLVALADMYDALTSKRVYKDAMSHEKAHQIICSLRGTHFDPRIVDAFEDAAHCFDQARIELAAMMLPWPGRIAA